MWAQELESGPPHFHYRELSPSKFKSKDSISISHKHRRKKWTPSNITWRKLDILKGPRKEDGTSDLEGRFDVVHVRLLIWIVQKGDPMPLLSNLMALMKPGGYLYWQEYNLLSQKLVVAGDEESDLTSEEAERASPALARLRRALSQSVNVSELHAWVQNMHERVAEVGGELVAHADQYHEKQIELVKASFAQLVANEPTPANPS
ncbi:hypothetical protein BST61_g9638 [Cercospora zeina]